MAEPTTPEKPAAPPPAEQPKTTATATEEPELRFTREAFDKRVEQARRAHLTAYLKSKGYDSEEAFDAARAKADKLAKDAEKAEREKLSEMERLRADLAEREKKLAESEQARQQAVGAAEVARTQAHLNRLCSERGIRNLDYALVKIERAVDGLKDGEDLDEVAFLDALVKDPAEAAALGLGSRSSATTTTPAKGPERSSAKAGPSKGKFTADEMTDAEWRAWQRERGIYG
jgi:hypothetical protein